MDPPSSPFTPPNASITSQSFGNIRPNSQTLQWMLLFQLIFPLCIYALFLYVCIRKTFKIPKVLAITVGITVVWSVIVCALFYVFNVPFW